jgi:hypothetical protein
MTTRLVLNFVLLVMASKASLMEHLDLDVFKGGLQNEHQMRDLQPLPLNGFSPSPKCWKNAINLFHSEIITHTENDISSFCASLPESHQKLLALEIASCQLIDLGKELYRDDGFREVCMRSLDGDIDRKLTVCLKQLTETGENTYTVYITYVQNMCIRLTQELVLQRLQESRQIALSQYREVSTESMKHMAAIKDLFHLYKDQIVQLSRITSEISQKLSMDLSNIVQDVVQASMEKEMTQHFNGQVKDIFEESIQSLTVALANDHNGIIEALFERVEGRDEVNQERFEEWSEYLLSLWQRQAIAMDQQRDAIKEHLRQMENLNEVVRSTTDSMQSLRNLQQMVLLVIVGYKWTSALLYSACTIITTRMLTNVLGCSGRLVYMVTVIEFALELLCSAFCKYNGNIEWTNGICVPALRKWAIVIEILVLTCCTVAKFSGQRLSKRRNARYKAYKEYYENAGDFRRHHSTVVPRTDSNNIFHDQFTPITYVNKKDHMNFQPHVRHIRRLTPTDYSKMIESKDERASSCNRVGQYSLRESISGSIVLLPNKVGAKSKMPSNNGLRSTYVTRSPRYQSMQAQTSNLTDVDSFMEVNSNSSVLSVDETLDPGNNKANSMLHQNNVQNDTTFCVQSDSKTDQTATTNENQEKGAKTKRLLVCETLDEVSPIKKQKVVR